MQLGSNDAQAIAKKLGAHLKTGRKHDLAQIYYGEKLVAQYGIRRSSKSVGHDYIPGQIHVSSKQAKSLADCTMKFEEWVALMKSKGFIEETERGAKGAQAGRPRS